MSTVLTTVFRLGYLWCLPVVQSDQDLINLPQLENNISCEADNMLLFLLTDLHYKLILVYMLHIIVPFMKRAVAVMFQ